MSMSWHHTRTAHRALLWGCALVLVAGTGVVGAATASPSVHQYFKPVATGGTFLPTTGKAVPDRPDWLHEIKYAAIASVWSPTASAFARSPSSAPPEMQKGDAELAPPS